MLIDARPKRTSDKGMIPGSVNISDSEFDKHVDKLPADKATPLIFYCGGLDCVLSDKSAAKAKALGYTDVKTYPEGYPGMGEAVGEHRPRAARRRAPHRLQQVGEHRPGQGEGFHRRGFLREDPRRRRRTRSWWSMCAMPRNSPPPPSRAQ